MLSQGIGIGCKAYQRADVNFPEMDNCRSDSFAFDAQVIEQVEHVALAVKQGSEISDLRHHTFSAPALKVKPCKYTLHSCMYATTSQHQPSRNSPPTAACILACMPSLDRNILQLTLLPICSSLPQAMGLMSSISVATLSVGNGLMQLHGHGSYCIMLVCSRVHLTPATCTLLHVQRSET